MEDTTLRSNPKKSAKALELMDSTTDTQPELTPMRDSRSTLTKQAATHMIDALKEDLKKKKKPDPNTAPPLYDSDSDSDATAIEAESSPMQEPLRHIETESEDDGSSQCPKKKMKLDEDLLRALKELPNIVKTLKDVVADLKVAPASKEVQNTDVLSPPGEAISAINSFQLDFAPIPDEPPIFTVTSQA